MLGEADKKSCRYIYKRLPRNVIDQRPAGKSVYEREMIDDQYDFADDERADYHSSEIGEGNSILLQHQALRQHQQTDGDKEKQRRRNDRQYFMPDRCHQILHG